MKKFLVAGIAAALISIAPARAAPADSMFNWTGFYAGLNGGWIDRRTDWAFPNGRTANQSGDSGLWGSQFGFQQQFGVWVLGVEGALDFVPRWSSTLCPGGTFNCQSRLTSFWTVGPRLGYAANNWLFFVTGGYAQGQMNTRGLDVNTGAPFEYTGGRNTGWYVGGGVDYAVTKNIVVGVEYQRLNLGNHLQCVGDCTAGSVDNKIINATADVVKGRLTWKLGPPFGAAN